MLKIKDCFVSESNPLYLRDLDHQCWPSVQLSFVINFLFKWRNVLAHLVLEIENDLVCGLMCYFKGTKLCWEAQSDWFPPFSLKFSPAVSTVQFHETLFSFSHLLEEAILILQSFLCEIILFYCFTNYPQSQLVHFSPKLVLAQLIPKTNGRWFLSFRLTGILHFIAFKVKFLLSWWT